MSTAYLYPKAMGLRPGAAASTVARVESTARTAQAPSLTSLVKALMREPTSTPEELNSRLSENDLVRTVRWVSKERSGRMS